MAASPSGWAPFALAMALVTVAGCPPEPSGPDGGDPDGGTDAGPDGGPDGGGPDGGGDAGTVYLPDPTVTGNVRRVCPSGCPYALPSAALAAAVDGDTIQIEYGAYVDCARVTKNNLIIRGVADGGARPQIHSKVCNQKGILVVQSASVLIEGLDLHDAGDPTGVDNNWACIRFDSIAGARNLKVRDCHLHNADNGLLGNNTSTAPNTLVIEDSVFDNLGRVGFAHGMYIGTAVDLFVLRNSVVRSNHDDGHLVKSRALANIIECNSIAALQGPNSFEVDLPQGGDAVLRDNVIQAGPNLSNSGNYLVNYAEENGNNAPHSLRLTNNVFVNDYPVQGKVNIAVAATTSGWSGNSYVGTASAPNLIGYSGPAAFVGYASRAAAGLPAYDQTMASLPSPPHCP